MTVLDDNELAVLKIDRMVFHIVGPKPEHFQRLEELTPGTFAPFFLDRIRSASRGNGYKFSDASATRERLLRILMNGSVFQEESEKLAEDFQATHGGAAAPGAFLVFLLSAGDRRAFALLKYDDDTVLTYELQDADEGRKRATLASLQRNFVKNPDALQKAALIALDPEPGVLTVLDRRNAQKVARYFENFLSARREFTDVELTKSIHDAAVEVILENEDLVPPDVFREVRRRVYGAASGGGNVDADRSHKFLETALGVPLPEDSPLIVKFKSKLRQRRIETESFDLAPDGVRRPARRRVETVNGISIRFGEDHQDLVHIDEAAGQIVINDRVRINDVEPDPNPRIGRSAR